MCLVSITLSLSYRAERPVTNVETFKIWVRAPLCDPNLSYYGSSSVVLQRAIVPQCLKTLCVLRLSQTQALIQLALGSM